MKDDLARVQYEVIDCPEPSRIEEAFWIRGETSSHKNSHKQVQLALIQPQPQDGLDELEPSQTC